MISLAKRGSLHARRQAAQTVYGKDALRKLFGEVAQQFQNRPGGYTRIVKTDWRRGDHAPMSLIELVALEESKSQVQKKKRRPKGTPPKRGESTQEAVPSP
jgi:large subunit ribosomal protein L17